MYTTVETRDQAIALTTALNLSITQREGVSPIATLTVETANGGLKFCQYPDSFCEFKEIAGEETRSWEYSRCTCGMEAPSEPVSIWEADLVVKFPDVYGRLVHFAMYGNQTFLFLENICQGPLDHEPTCLCLHHHDFS